MIMIMVMVVMMLIYMVMVVMVKILMVVMIMIYMVMVVMMMMFLLRVSLLLQHRQWHSLQTERMMKMTKQEQRKATQFKASAARSLIIPPFVPKPSDKALSEISNFTLHRFETFTILSPR